MASHSMETNQVTHAQLVRARAMNWLPMACLYEGAARVTALQVSKLAVRTSSALISQVLASTPMQWTEAG